LKITGFSLDAFAKNAGNVAEITIPIKYTQKLMPLGRSKPTIENMTVKTRPVTYTFKKRALIEWSTNL
ncbi:hypothetical protein, partial [Bariatricus massiliensis]|uniref:hypothetical protein n=1 Tax=Bariatricus massiliensis TaxID=1745713 RepID=UPI001D07E2D9